MAQTYNPLAGAVTSAGGSWSFVGGSDGAVFNSDNADTSYSSTNDNDSINRYALAPDAPAGAIAVVSVDITTWKARSSEDVERGLTLGLYLGGNTTFGTVRAVPISASYTTYSDLALARPGGGSWGVSDVNSMELVTRSTLGAANSAARITYVLITVTYLTSGGFIFAPVMFRRRV